ncbi:FHA domain-containing protein [Sporolactobacillus vineae]|uniref:FHA domain-containing protein n=1 Tax=Sporolactobacillus vineae TaxID=444463 RepID=UPI000288C5E6|nr:FHA domain-containing protein [Sporolactobacillus vineae]
MSNNLTLIYLIIGVALVANVILIIAIMRRKNTERPETAVSLYQKLQDSETGQDEDRSKTTALSDVQAQQVEKARKSMPIPENREEEKTEMLHPISNLSPKIKGDIKNAGPEDATMLLSKDESIPPLQKQAKRTIDYQIGSEKEQYSWTGSEPVRIGRDPDQCDLVIANDGYVGRVHALIYTKSGKYYLVDLDSKNGTYIESRQVKGQEELAAGQYFKIGKTELVVN